MVTASSRKVRIMTRFPPLCVLIQRQIQPILATTPKAKRRTTQPKTLWVPTMRAIPPRAITARAITRRAKTTKARIARATTTRAILPRSTTPPRAITVPTPRPVTKRRAILPRLTTARAIRVPTPRPVTRRGVMRRRLKQTVVVALIVLQVSSVVVSFVWI